MKNNGINHLMVKKGLKLSLDEMYKTEEFSLIRLESINEFENNNSAGYIYNEEYQCLFLADDDGSFLGQVLHVQPHQIEDAYETAMEISRYYRMVWDSYDYLKVELEEIRNDYEI